MPRHKPNNRPNNRELLVRAAAHVCGGQIALAKALGVSRSAVAKWISGDLRVSERRAEQMRYIIRHSSE